MTKNLNKVNSETQEKVRKEVICNKHVSGRGITFDSTFIQCNLTLIRFWFKYVKQRWITRFVSLSKDNKAPLTWAWHSQRRWCWNSLVQSVRSVHIKVFVYIYKWVPNSMAQTQKGTEIYYEASKANSRIRTWMIVL